MEGSRKKLNYWDVRRKVRQVAYPPLVIKPIRTLHRRKERKNEYTITGGFFHSFFPFRLSPPWAYFFNSLAPNSPVWRTNRSIHSVFLWSLRGGSRWKAGRSRTKVIMGLSVLGLMSNLMSLSISNFCNKKDKLRPCCMDGCMDSLRMPVKGKSLACGGMENVSPPHPCVSSLEALTLRLRSWSDD